MKKNLRIVSAAAAALLAVAPVAATAVSTVSASAITDITLPGTNAQNAKGDITLNSSVKAVTYPEESVVNNVTGQVTDHMWNGSLTGSVTASYKGASYDVTLAGTPVAIFKAEKQNLVEVQPNAQGKYRLEPGKAYYVFVKNASINMSTANANLKNLTLGGNGQVFFPKDGSVSGSLKSLQSTLTVNTNQNGGVYQAGSNLGTQFDMFVKVVPHDITNLRAVSFYEKASGKEVPSGTLDLSVNSSQTMNIRYLLAKFNEKYDAHQLEGNTNSGAQLTTTVDDIKAQLEKQGMSVDANDNFVANANFSLSFTAKSAANGAVKTLPVTVNVAGGKVVAPATVPSQSKTIRHNAYYYDKDAKRVGTDKLTRYNSVNVAMSTTTIKGKAYYEVIENGKATGKFINADNIDGTKRTLKHNAYVYKTSKKRANKVVLKKGKEVTTYGGTYTFKNGKQYYKIGNNTDKTYVKASNF